MSEIEAYNSGTELDMAQAEEVGRIKQSINLTDTNSIVTYGAQPQRKSSEFLDALLSSVKTKELNETGALLSSLMGDIQKFDAAGGQKNFIARLFNSAEGQLKKLRSTYMSVSKNVDSIIDTLEKNRLSLMQSNAMLDKLYERSVDYINEIKLYIVAGEEKIDEVNNGILPALKKETEKSNDELAVQRYRDLAEASVRFEKKIHDLKLTRTVYVQSLPQIRLQQGTNNTLIDKIHSSLVNAIPLWKSQMAIALGLAHTTNALRAQKAVTETTNELLKRNSELLRMSTTEAARENERSIIDINVIKKANSDILSTIKEIVQIQQEGRAKRVQAENELKKLETELKDNILRAFER